MQKNYNRFTKLKLKKEKKKLKKKENSGGGGGKLYRTVKAQCRGRGL